MIDLRLYRIFIIFGFSSIIYTYLGFLVIKRDQKLPNLYLSCFYFIGASYMVLNMIYAVLTDVLLVNILHLWAIYLGMSSYCFLFLFTASISMTSPKDWKIRHFVYILLYHTILSAIFFIPNGAIITKASNYHPEWSGTLALFLFITISIFVVIPCLVIFKKMHSVLTAEFLKKSWIFFMSGSIGYFIVLYGTIIFNHLNDPIFEISYMIIGFLCIPSAILFYLGITFNS